MGDLLTSRRHFSERAIFDCKLQAPLSPDLCEARSRHRRSRVAFAREFRAHALARVRRRAPRVCLAASTSSTPTANT
eukprot:975500-Pleurochrysis_carterae.AAC.3